MNKTNAIHLNDRSQIKSNVGRNSDDGRRIEWRFSFSFFSRYLFSIIHHRDTRLCENVHAVFWHGIAAFLHLSFIASMMSLHRHRTKSSLFNNYVPFVSSSTPPYEIQRIQHLSRREKKSDFVRCFSFHCCVFPLRFFHHDCVLITFS